MITFLIGLAILIAGAALYSILCEKAFHPDFRKTPAYVKKDGLDFVPIKGWKNCFINLLNISGIGVVLGSIQGILFGPLAFLTIPVSNILGGAVHDYFSGMISLRDGGVQMSTLVKKYTNKAAYVLYSVFVCLFLLLVSAVFVYTPGDIALTQLFSYGGDKPVLWAWIIYGVILIWYFIAAVLPVDKLIGKVYPVFGAVLILSSLGVLAGTLIKGGTLVEVWAGTWQAEGMFSYSEYFAGHHFFTLFFVTVASGILSGFHSTQVSIVSRTLRNEREGRRTFYWMMAAEGLIAMIWAAGAMSAFNAGLADPSASATENISLICRGLLGNVGGMIALAGVVLLPLTTGDTALRSLRLTLSEVLDIDQSTAGGRFGLTAVLCVLTGGIVAFAKFCTNGFTVLWSYAGLADEIIALFSFAVITIWLFVNGRGKFAWIALLPGAFCAYVAVAFLAGGTGFGLAWKAADAAGIAFAVLYSALLVVCGKKKSSDESLKTLQA